MDLDQHLADYDRSERMYEEAESRLVGDIKALWREFSWEPHESLADNWQVFLENAHELARKHFAGDYDMAEILPYALPAYHPFLELPSEPERPARFSP